MGSGPDLLIKYADNFFFIELTLLSYHHGARLRNGTWSSIIIDSTIFISRCHDVSSNCRIVVQLHVDKKWSLELDYYIDSTILYRVAVMFLVYTILTIVSSWS